MQVNTGLSIITKIYLNAPYIFNIYTCKNRFPGDYNEEQLKCLEKFKKEIKDIGYNNILFDDAYFLRFLRARKFDLKETVIMWKNFINWRKENDVDNINNFVFGEIDEVRQFYPHAYFKTDKQGRPVYIQRLGALKLQQLFKCTNEDRLIKYYAQTYENLLHNIFPACSKAAGHRIDQMMVILDLKGGQTKIMSKQLYDFIQRLINVAQDNYPEILAKMYIVNSPLLFSGIWAIIKPWLDEKTKSKITILGSQYETQLLENIDASNLPDFLGGNCTQEEYGLYFDKEQGPWVENDIYPLKSENSPRSPEDEKNGDDIDKLKNMLVGMNIAGKTAKNNTKKEQDEEDFSDMNIHNLKIFVPDTPINTQIGDEDDKQQKEFLWADT